MNRTGNVLDTLVQQGTLSEQQAQAVLGALAESGEAREFTRRRIVSEILSYVGGAVIVVSAGFIVAQAWEPLGVIGRLVVILGIAAILFAAGWVLAGRLSDDMGRRLSSALMTAAAALTGLAIGVTVAEVLGDAVVETTAGQQFDPGRAWTEAFTALTAAAGAMVVAALGYVRSHSALGQIALGAALAMTLLTSAWTVNALVNDSSNMPVAGALLVMAMGATWLVLALRGAFAEPVVGQFVGMVAMAMGAQWLRESVDADWLVPVLMLVGGLALMAAYAALRQWPLLVGGVGGVIVGGTELLIVYAEGIIAAFGSLLLGLVMLAVGLRLLRERRHAP